ncbi:hypothetical protein MSG28_014382 [Choristoneura fumiferana]|uniref:Uncharacterized protein n=1 Tax=Choristoneura fumiferana TaxID=7141 RepID=A0ACC0JGX3_CHOFU|nr:hypothetical protein MSG28_014382 [Choristoneura fumiferana]
MAVVNADGRPILRTGVDDSGSSYEAESVPEDKPSWLVGLRARIEKLVSRYGYEAAKSHIQKTVEGPRPSSGTWDDQPVYVHSVVLSTLDPLLAFPLAVTGVWTLWSLQ